jgi:hypothetical protein
MASDLEKAMDAKIISYKYKNQIENWRKQHE